MLGAVRSARVARPWSQRADRADLVVDRRATTEPSARSVVMKVGFAQYAVGQLLLAPLVVWVANVALSLSVNGGLR